MAARAVCLDAARAQRVEERLCQYAACRVASTQNEDVIRPLHDLLSLRICQRQQPGAQPQPPGLVARIKALMNLPSISGATAFTSRPALSRIPFASAAE